MKKKAMAAVLMMSMVIGSSLTVCAAPEIMADGTVFDAEYYAQMYPDVVAALGTDADAMYQHYVTFGQYEGRQAYRPDAVIPQSVSDLVENTSIPSQSTWASDDGRKPASQTINPDTGEVYEPGHVFENGLIYLGEIVTLENGDQVFPDGSVFHRSKK